MYILMSDGTELTLDEDGKVIRSSKLKSSPAPDDPEIDEVEKAYDPNQPRHPKGRREGGRWSGQRSKSGMRNYVEMMSRFSGFGEWYLKHGQDYEIDDQTFIGGTPKECYKNAFLAMMNNEYGGEDSEDLTYVEGFMGVHGVPIHHAWLVTKDGKVRDYTIKEADRNIVTGYYGVPMKWKFVQKQTLKNQAYGLTAGFAAHKVLQADPRTVVEGK